MAVCQVAKRIPNLQSLRINSEWVCDALLEWLEVVLAVVKNVACVEMATPRAAVDGNPTTSW